MQRGSDSSRSVRRASIVQTTDAQAWAPPTRGDLVLKSLLKERRCQEAVLEPEEASLLLPLACHPVPKGTSPLRRGPTFPVKRSKGGTGRPRPGWGWKGFLFSGEVYQNRGRARTGQHCSADKTFLSPRILIATLVWDQQKIAGGYI